MKKKLLCLLSLCTFMVLLLAPVSAGTGYNPAHGGTNGSTWIVGIGGVSYKQAQIETTTKTNVDLISVSGVYRITNGNVIGYPSDSNRWSRKAQATMTYEGSKVMECSTTHTANGNVKFYTFDRY